MNSYVRGGSSVAGGEQGRGKGIASDEESFTLLLVKVELRSSQGRASSRRNLLAWGANE